MPSHDKRWSIERYPTYVDTESGNGNTIVHYSYGCPNLNLMGYENICVLLLDIGMHILDEQKLSQITSKENK